MLSKFMLQLEDLFRRTKSVLRTRLIYHSSDAAIRGHVFCSFLALMLQKELAMLSAARAILPRPERQGLPRVWVNDFAVLPSG